MKKLRLLRESIFNTFVFPLLTVAILCAWGAGTESGLRASLHLISHYYFTGNLEVGQASGRLLGEINLHHVKFPIGSDATVTIDTVRTRWQLLDFVSSFFSNESKNKAKLAISELALNTVKIRAKDSLLLSLPQLNLQGDIDYHRKQMQLHTLNAKAADFTLFYAWQPAVRWKFSLVAKALNPYNLEQLTHRELTKLNFVLQGKGDDEQASFEIANLTGKLHDRAISGHARWEGELDGKSWAVDTALAVGDAQAQLRGKLGKTWDLQWQLAVPDIKAILPEAAGHLMSNGKITGPRQAPHTTSVLVGNKLDFKGYKLAKLDAKFDMDLAEQGIAHTVIAAQHLKYKHVYLDRLQFDGTGTTGSHVGTLTLTTDRQKKLVARIKGGLDVKAKRWRANLQALDFLTQQGVKRWRLEKPTPLVVTPTHFSISPFNWVNGNGKEVVRVLGQWKKKESASAHLQLNQVRLASLPTLLTLQHQLHLTGKLNADLQFDKQWKQAPTLKGYMRLVGSDAKIKIGKTVAQLGSLHGELNASGDKLRYTLTAQSKQKGEMALRGETHLDRLLTASSNADAMLAHLTLTGHNFWLIDSPTLKLDVSPTLEINVYPGMLKVTGKVIAPKALINPHALYGTTKLTSDIVFINQDKKKKAKKLKADKKAKHAFAIYTDIRLLLGKEVTIDLKGLEGQLVGELRLIHKPDQLMIANGQLKILRGTYTKYGETLTVSDGRLNFVNSPINNPQINIVAVRQFEAASNLTGGAFGQHASLVVGVKIYGKLRHPQTHLFSEPGGRSQSDILSMLILGQSNIDLNDDNKTALLLKAATALNFGKHHAGIGTLINKLRHELGLAEFGVESETRLQDDDQDHFNDVVLKNSSLVLGKYISRKLYVKYSRGLLEPLDTVNLRYNLGRHLKLQTQSNQEGNGVDMLYTLDR